MEFTNYFIMFLIGFVSHMVWAYVLHLGYCLILVKEATEDVLKLVGKASQTAFQVYELKYLVLQQMDKSEVQIEHERRVDEIQLKSIQDTIIRNIITNYPPRYVHSLGFHDWDSAMQYLTEVLKNRRD